MHTRGNTGQWQCRSGGAGSAGSPCEALRNGGRIFCRKRRYIKRKGFIHGSRWIIYTVLILQESDYFLSVQDKILIRHWAQHRTKNALRLSTTSACSISVILHKTCLITVRLLTRFAHSDEKNWRRICGTIFVRYCLNTVQWSKIGASNKNSEREKLCLSEEATFIMQISVR